MLVKTALRDFDQSDFEAEDWTAIVALKMMIFESSCLSSLFLISQTALCSLFKRIK